MRPAAQAILEREAILAHDERARREALAPDRSVLLQAPAGSGKTTVLTARFLGLLARVEAPEHIIAITFTRKAAAEMRQRVLSALRGEEGQARGIPAQLLEGARRRDQQLGWELGQNPARLRIQTLDALNHWLARIQPVAARALPALQISDAPVALYSLAARRCLTAAWSEPSLRPAAELLFARLDNSWMRLERLTAAMLARRSHCLPRLLRASGGGLGASVEQALQALIRSELARALARLPPALLEQGCVLVSHAGAAAASAAPLGSEPSDLGRWRALARLALNEKEAWRASFSRRDGFAPEDKDMKRRAAAWIAQLRSQHDAAALLRSVRDLPDPQLPASDVAALEALAQLLRRAAAELKLVFAECGRADHTEMAAAARSCLTEDGEASDLALRAGEAIRHILVDEFQDTSLEQFEMLRALTASWSRGDGRTLFLVGDPMQSVYQFREAEVGLFLRARERGLGDIQFEPLQLRRNFRTRAGLLDWINQRFGQLFPLQDDARLAAVRYLPCVAADGAAAAHTNADPPEALAPTPASAATASSQPPVTLHRFEPGDASGEARRTLEIVQQERAADPSASIAVLVAGREHATAISAVLRAAALPVRGVDLEPLRDRPVVRDLSALTRVLLHGADRTAWLALLRAPGCGLTLAQLNWLCAHDSGDLLECLLEQTRCVAHNAEPLADAAAGVGALCSPAQLPGQELRAPLARVCEALLPALRGSERSLQLWQRVQRCWLRLSGPAIYPSEIDRLDARRFLDALAMHDAPETLAGEAVAGISEGLYSAGAAHSGAIQIMTMHAAKGLEWDVVILPGLGRTTARDDERLLQWLDLPRPDSGADLLLCPIRQAQGLRQRAAPRSLEGYIKRIRSERARIERVRLLYVAATRARRSLHLMGALGPSASGPAAKPRPDSPLALLWPALGAEFLSTPLAAAGAGSSPAPGPAAGVAAASGAMAALGDAPVGASGALLRLPREWRLPPLPPSPEVQRLRAPTSTRAAPEYRWVGVTARAVGTIVHAELHRLALSTVLPQATEALRRLPDYGPWLAELDVPALERPKARAGIARALEFTLSDERGRWLLSGSHPQVRSEWRLTGLHEGRLITVVFDRTLVDGHGQRWVVDFKTSVHEGAGQEQFIEAEMERHRLQLTRYAALARALGPEPVRAALYFPLLGVFRELGATA